MEKMKAKWTQVSLKNVLKVKNQRLSRQICETCNLRVFFGFFLLLVGSGPKRSLPIEKLGTSSVVSSIFQREGKLYCSFTGRKLWSQVKKNCSRHLIYARACVNKDFVPSGSIGLREGKHAHYVINYIRKKTSHPWLVNDRYKTCYSRPIYCYNSKTNKECRLHIKYMPLKTWVLQVWIAILRFLSIITQKSWEIMSKICRKYQFPREARRFLRIQQ